jgi:hypothetical protein
MTDKETTYPWLRLLELELKQEVKLAKRRRPGRPKNAFPRKRVRASLTDEELAALDGLVDVLSARLGRALHRGHLIAFMTFRLRNQLEQGGQINLPADIDSFAALAKHLDFQGSPDSHPPKTTQGRDL